MSQKIYKILITEDEKPMAHALQLKLSHEGFVVDIASDGAEAIEILKKKEYDLLILDLITPKVDGFGVLEDMKKREDKTTVIVASNLGQEEDFARAKDLGAVEFFVKSDISISEIVTRVKKLISSEE